MKEIFESLTRSEYEALKAYYLSTGMHERVFYNLKKKQYITVAFLADLYKVCGVVYDYKTGILSREKEFETQNQ